MEMSMGGSILQEQRFDGVKGKVAGMGQSQIVTEGNEYDQMKEAAVAFGQLNYLTDGTSLNSKGIEDINGKKAYKVEVIKASGKKNYEYYDMTSNLLVRTLEVEEAPEGQEPQSMVTDISDYKEVNGIMLPHTITITGAMPFPLTMKADAYMINSDIPSDKFKVD